MYENHVIHSFASDVGPMSYQNEVVTPERNSVNLISSTNVLERVFMWHGGCIAVGEFVSKGITAGTTQNPNFKS